MYPPNGILLLKIYCIDLNPNTLILARALALPSPSLKGQHGMRTVVGVGAQDGVVAGYDRKTEDDRWVMNGRGLAEGEGEV